MKNLSTRIASIVQAWGELRPKKSFSGLTLEQFKKSVQASQDARAEIASLEARMQAAIAQRVTADVPARETVQRIVHAVRGDADEGENGELYAAMGFIPKGLRSTGLTRRRVNGNGTAKPTEGTV